MLKKINTGLRALTAAVLSVIALSLPLVSSGTSAEPPRTDDNETMSDEGAFMVAVEGVEGGTLECRPVWSQYTPEEVINHAGHTYGTDTRTHRMPDFFTTSPQNVASLSFQGVSGSNAFGGRCETQATDALTGDGTFSARVLFPENMRETGGIYSIGIMTNTFPVRHSNGRIMDSSDYGIRHRRELDLFVANILPLEGEIVPLIKVGNPQNARSVEITDDMIGQWLTIKLVRTGNNCTLSITHDDGTEVPVGDGSVSCEMADVGDVFGGPTGVNRIVINSRALTSDSREVSTVLISDVTWERAGPAIVRPASSQGPSLG